MIGAWRSPGPGKPRVSHADIEWRCRIPQPSGQHRRSSCNPPSDRSLRGESRRSDGKATTLFSSRADLAVFRGCHEFRTSIGFKAVQVASSPRIRPREVQRYCGSEAHGASKSRPYNNNLALIAYWHCIRQPPNPAYSDVKRASGSWHVTLAQSGLCRPIRDGW
jgi:hypothetical protein